MGKNRFIDGYYTLIVVLFETLIRSSIKQYSLFSDRAPDTNELITSNKKDQVSSLI